jgi:predicted nucleic acid-binding protein
LTVLLDTSVIIAWEQGLVGSLPEDWTISAITLGELHVGVLLAEDAELRGIRTMTLASIESSVSALAFDDEAARVFGRIVSRARRAGRRPKGNDAIIAATAIANGMALYAADRDFTAFPDLDPVLLTA